MTLKSIEPSLPESANTAQSIVVLTTMPDNELAQQLASLLVRQGLAACVNILPACTSVYIWPGNASGKGSVEIEPNIENTTEIPLMIKTTLARYGAVQAAIRDQHPYELPEIIHVGINGGLPAYLDWISQQTSPRGIVS